MNVRDHMALRLAFAQFRHEGVRVARMHDELGYSETQFWARVNWLLDQVEPEVEYPAEVRRLRRLRAGRRAVRRHQVPGYAVP